MKIFDEEVPQDKKWVDVGSNEDMEACPSCGVPITLDLKRKHIEWHQRLRDRTEIESRPMYE